MRRKVPSVHLCQPVNRVTNSETVRNTYMTTRRGNKVVVAPNKIQNSKNKNKNKKQATECQLELRHPLVHMASGAALMKTLWKRVQWHCNFTLLTMG